VSGQGQAIVNAKWTCSSEQGLPRRTSEHAHHNENRRAKRNRFPVQARTSCRQEQNERSPFTAVPGPSRYAALPRSSGPRVHGVVRRHSFPREPALHRRRRARHHLRCDLRAAAYDRAGGSRSSAPAGIGERRSKAVVPTASAPRSAKACRQPSDGSVRPERPKVA